MLEMIMKLQHFCLSEIGGKTHLALYMIELYNSETEGGKTMAFFEKKKKKLYILKWKDQINKFLSRNVCINSPQLWNLVSH